MTASNEPCVGFGAIAKSGIRATSLLGGLLFTMSSGCLQTADYGQTSQSLTVCHSTTVQGVDVSEFQGTVNWSQVKASGRQFAIARVGDGTYRDPTFARNWSAIRSAGMIRGAYLFFRPTDSATAQAYNISSAVGHLGAGDLPVTIDVECSCPVSDAPYCNYTYSSNCATPSTTASVLRQLVSLVATDTGKPPIIYTGGWYWDGSTYLNGAANESTHTLWVADYTTGCPTLPGTWTDWKFWQYSDGTCVGCPDRCVAVPGFTNSNPSVCGGRAGVSVDRDVWAGTLTTLREFAGLVTPDAGMDAGAADSGARDAGADVHDATMADTRRTDTSAADRTVADAPGTDVIADHEDSGTRVDVAGDAVADGAEAGSMDATSGDVADAGAGTMRSGCGCRAPGRHGRSTPWWAGGVSVIGAIAIRRRRVRSPCRGPRPTP